jgi:Di-haem oxidoreductase, putative peroxidase
MCTRLRAESTERSHGQWRGLRREHARATSIATRLAVPLIVGALALAANVVAQSPVGRELSVPRHLEDGDEFRIPLDALRAHGERLFTAMWTDQEGGGRPLTKGTGALLADPSRPLTFPRNFNRVSAPDANSCAGCHNLPVAGGGGDVVTNAFVLGQRFDLASFDVRDILPTQGAFDERGMPATLQSIANSRATPGMFGSGYIEMLARQMTADLQAIRDRVPPGHWSPLVTKGVSFGRLARLPDGRWDVSKVEGLVAPSLQTTGPADPPSLVIRPFHQASNVVSLRQFTNNAFNHHHGIQPTERFGEGDPDGDGFTNELTRADVTAASIFQAVMAVPGRVIPNDPEIEAAVLLGEQRFAALGCTSCHRPSLPLDRLGWLYSEPNPYNPPGNLRPGDAARFIVDLTRSDLPAPRLRPDDGGVIHVPAFTDLKVHDICDGPDDPNIEPLDASHAPGSPEFFHGNRRFLTRRLWGAASEPPFFHHGQFTTLRQAVLAHGGEAAETRRLFRALPAHEQDAVIEFLKSLQVLPPGTRHLVVDERGLKKPWPPR